MPGVTELGYIGLTVSEPTAWQDYATSVVGMEAFREDGDDTLYLRMDYWHHRFAVRKGAADDLDYVGWRVADQAALEAMAEKLSAAGHDMRFASEEEISERRVLGLIKTTDPAGNPTELFHGPRVDRHKPFYPGRPLHGKFQTGEQGMGHVVLRSEDVAASHAFYTLLGMTGATGYYLNSPVGTIKPVFMHCNNRQHSVAFNVPSEKRLNHLMLEYAELDDLGLVYDIVNERQIPVVLDLGKHSNDLALTFYSVAPSGWLMELGWGGGGAGTQTEYHHRDVFGHALKAAGMGLDVEL